jgi:hypothetical protein
MMARPKKLNREEYVGRVFGRLTILALAEPRVSAKGNKTPQCWVRCSCDGKEYITIFNNVVRGLTSSCGCYSIECTKVRNATHGLSKHPLHSIFSGIRARCYKTYASNYPRYGGRGITICDEWVNDFEAFIKWALANGWKKGLEIDRMDNEGPYSPENCRIVTREVNGRNKRNNVKYKIGDEMITAPEIYERFGPGIVSLKAFVGRMKLGWDYRHALNTPVQGA